MIARAWHHGHVLHTRAHTHTHTHAHTHTHTHTQKSIHTLGAAIRRIWLTLSKANRQNTPSAHAAHPAYPAHSLTKELLAEHVLLFFQVTQHTHTQACDSPNDCVHGRHIHHERTHPHDGASWQACSCTHPYDAHGPHHLDTPIPLACRAGVECAVPGAPVWAQAVPRPADHRPQPTRWGTAGQCAYGRIHACCRRCDILCIKQLCHGVL